MSDNKENVAQDETRSNTEPTAREYSVSSDERGVRDKDKTSRLPQALQNVYAPSLRRPGWLDRGLVIAILVALLAGFGGGWLGANYHDNSSMLGSDLSTQKKIVTTESQLITKIAKAVGPSVVSVNVTGTETTPSDFFGLSTQQDVQAAGTGIIISSDGIVMTNRHVVPAGTKTVSVTLADGTEFRNVKVLGRTSSNDSLDVAFLKITDTKGKQLHPVTIGDSSKVAVGDTVVAFGNALGQFQNTVTSGIISGYGRSVQASSNNGSSAENLDDLFQTDAAINEGNSGGPLVNMNGQVIGINTAIAGNAQNIGFAIPVNDITGLIKQVMDTGKVARPFLGVHYVLLTDDYAYQFNLSTKRGAYIAPSQDGSPSIVPDSPADKAGLQEKDIITKVNGTNVDEKHSLVSLLGQHQPGDTVSLNVVRDGKAMTIKVKLGTAPTDSTQ